MADEYEISIGVIPYRTRISYREYLVLQSRTGDWEFPKGKIENGESQQSCAKREFTEETDVEEFRLVEPFKENYLYHFSRGEKTVYKNVNLFLAHVYNPTETVNLNGENVDAEWLPYPKAKARLTHRSTERILENAKSFLDSRY